MRTLYEVLDVQETATAAQIKTTYHRLARENHPDLNQGDKAKEERFKKLQAAYNILGDPARRAAYDEELRAARAAAHAEAERKAAAARAEAERKIATDAAARKARFASQAAPRHSAITNKSSAGGADWGGVVVGLAGLGILTMAFSALGSSRSRGSRSSRWDPAVQRYRGKDGRFRSR